MSTAERKARKRAGIPFERKAKEGTPFTERTWFNTEFFVAKMKDGVKWRPRSVKKRNRALADRGLPLIGE